MYRCDVHKPFRGILRAKEQAVVEIHVPKISREKEVSDIGLYRFTSERKGGKYIHYIITSYVLVFRI